MFATAGVARWHNPPAASETPLSQIGGDIVTKKLSQLDPRMIIGPELGDFVWHIDLGGPRPVVDQADQFTSFEASFWYEFVRDWRAAPLNLPDVPGTFSFGSPGYGLGEVTYQVLGHCGSLGRCYVLLDRRA